jgi:Fe-S oxidoreductase/nitrate reductase gamma subunit
MATRQIYWNIEGHSLIYLFLMIALAFFIYGVYQHVKLWKIGQPENRWHDIGQGLQDVFIYSVLQKRILQEKYAGYMHIMVFLGFVFLFFATMIIAIQANLGFNIYKGGLYLFVKFTADLFGLLAIVGVLLAAWRRYIIQPQQLDNKPDDAIVLFLIFMMLITGFLLEGARLAALSRPWTAWEFVGNGVAILLAGFTKESLLSLHRFVWWFHMVVVMSFIGYFPYSKLIHVILVPLNHFFRTRGAVGVLKLIDFEDENLESFGKNTLCDFSWKTLFDSDACVRCGRCQNNCPAFLSGKHLNPKQVVQDLKIHMEEIGQSLNKPLNIVSQSGQIETAATELTSNLKSRTLIGEVIPEDDLWSCTTCRSCEQQCPVFIEHVDKFIELRRNLVMMENPFPEEAKLTFRNMENNGNPWGIGWATRGDYFKTLGVPMFTENPNAHILYWPGCSGAFDGRNRKVSQALVTLLQAAKVNFAILGQEEKCCGDSARRLGNEYLYYTLATENIEIMNSYNVKKIITQCPHCYNVLKNEYPQLGGKFEVLHHTEFLLQLVKTGRLAFKHTANESITYHDSCYLGRYNQIYGQPRELIKAVGLKLKEMPRSFEKSFCCGAGGGRMWLEEQAGEQINDLRAKQAAAVQPDLVGTACPFCLTMLTDGIANLNTENKIRIFDIAEILVKHLVTN